MRLIGASLAAALLAACASAPPPLDPSGPVPPDFLLEVASEGAENPHCDFRVALSADGEFDYEVRHRGTAPADRRGRTRLDAPGLRAVWAAVARSGVFSLPPRIEPRAGTRDPWAAERGEVSYGVRAAGRGAAVTTVHAQERGLEGVLAALFAAAPAVFTAPGASSP